jgi:putative pyoverdin transport system ATP-binding/permease protein
MLALLSFLRREGALFSPRVMLSSLGAGLSRGLLLVLLNAGISGTLSVWQLSGASGAVLLVFLFCTYYARISAHSLIEQLQCDLRIRLLGKVLHTDARASLLRDMGAFYNVLTHGISDIAYSSVRLLGSLQALAVIVFCLVYLSWIAPTVALAAMAMLMIAALACYSWDRRARVRLMQAHGEQSEFYDRVNDALRGFKEIRLNAARRKHLDRHARAIAAAARESGIAAERHFSMSNVASQAGMYGLLLALVFAWPAAGLMDAATTAQVLVTVLFTYGPLETLVGSYPVVARAAVGLEHLHATEAVLTDAQDQLGAELHANRFAEFREISLRDAVATVVDRDGGRSESGSELEVFQLGPLNLTIRRGEVVFVTGGNGSGKTTLLSLICGLRPLDSGFIVVDETQISAANAASYRAVFSAVFADYHVFRTLYGFAPQQTAEFTMLLDQLDLSRRTRVENGEMNSLALSAGQRRRLALAVALLENRPVLIFDEFAADQDPAHRVLFYEHLLPKLRAHGCTVIAVTHDQSRFHLCDQHVEMAHGRIVRVTGRSSAPPCPDAKKPRRTGGAAFLTLGARNE